MVKLEGSIRAGRVLAGAGLAAALLAPVAFAATPSTPKLVGSPTAGKTIFEANCAACHTLKAAASEGTIGPNLNKLVLTEATIIAQVTNGGSKLMGAAASKYTTQMVAYKNVLKPAQIDDVAAFVYVSTHPATK
jgi:mono/diheme cytochrome c family protein